MTVETIQIWIEQNPALAPWVVIAALIVSCLVGYLIARNLIARGLIALSRRTESQHDDIIVDNLRPFRFAWIAPLLIIYVFDLVREYLETELSELQWEGEDSPGRDRPTNMDIYRQYAIRYLRSCPDLHQEDQTLLVRQLAPGPSGLPLEIYAFANTTDWTTYEEIHAAILNHLLAALPHFGLRLFQQPTGADLHALKPQGN